MYNADSEYLGEQYPFWYPNTKEEDKKKAEFSPNKIKLMRKYPSWSIGPKKKKIELMKMLLNILKQETKGWKKKQI